MAKRRKKPDPERAEAAAEVLAAVWLNEKFDLESKISDPLVAEVDADGYMWITVQLHVPALDIDMWLERTHDHHPDFEDES